MEPLVLKKSCDACTHSKVKCTGEYPCERCVQKKIQCFYSPRKRRIKPKKPKTSKLGVPVPEADEDVIISKSNFDPAAPLGSLVDWERRSWSVFFTLYKHYGTSCSLHWFNRQLNKMRNYLKRQGNTESLRRLTAWMEALSIDVDGLAAQVEKCRIKILTERETMAEQAEGRQLSLHVTGTVNDKLQRRLQPILQQNNPRIPFLKMITSYSPDLEEDDVKLEVNSAFPLVFGVSETALREQLRWTGGGFLPWAGDVLSRLLTQEKDLLAFVQILAIKFNTLGKPDGPFPIIRDVPSCHMFEVNIKESLTSGKFIPVSCLVKCMHREIITREKSVLEISMEFTPLTPHDHLLKDFKQILNVDHHIEPYQQGTKRKADIGSYNEYTEETAQDFDEEDEEVLAGSAKSSSTRSSFYSQSNHSRSTNGMVESNGSHYLNKNLSFEAGAALVDEFFGDDQLNLPNSTTLFDSFATTPTIQRPNGNNMAPTGANFETESEFGNVFDDIANAVSGNISTLLPNLPKENGTFQGKTPVNTAKPGFNNNFADVNKPQNTQPQLTRTDSLNGFLNVFNSSDDMFSQHPGQETLQESSPDAVEHSASADMADTLEEDGFDFFEQQAEWLDGLLDWAGKKDLVTERR